MTEGESCTGYNKEGGYSIGDLFNHYSNKLLDKWFPVLPKEPEPPPTYPIRVEADGFFPTNYIAFKDLSYTFTLISKKAQTLTEITYNVFVNDTLLYRKTKPFPLSPLYLVIGDGFTLQDGFQ